MRLIPPHLSPAGVSPAERRVFERLRNTDLAGLTALHSLNLIQHDYQRLGEIDFLLVGGRGVYAIEVKGGRVACTDGIWSFTDRYGETRRESRGPVSQASNAVHSLVRRLASAHDEDFMTGLCFGFGVVLPDTDFNVASVEWDPALICDRTQFRDPGGLKRFLQGLMDYWEGKSRCRPRSPAEERLLLQALRPDFDRVPPLGQRAADLDERMVELTAEQYRLLDGLESNERVLCSGGAGTGKTFLALEAARRARAGGRRPLLTCKSSHLADFLAGECDGEEVTVVGIDELASSPECVFDELIVDEGQDVLDADALALLDACLVGGLSGGRWRIFLDHNNQAGVEGNFDPEALDLLLDLAPARFNLSVNCRNTAPIVDRVHRLTGAELGAPVVGHGPAPTMKFTKDRDEAAGLLEKHLETLMASGVDLSQVVVLCNCEPQDASAHRMSPKWRSRVEMIEGAPGAPGVVRLSTVRSFKGLESAFIAVTDVSRLDEKGVAELYVAMTRARVGLWVTLDSALRTDVERLLASGSSRGSGSTAG